MKKKTGRHLVNESNEPYFIIVDELDRAFVGMKEGYPVFSDDIDQAKVFNEPRKVNILKRYHHFNVEQMFI